MLRVILIVLIGFALSACRSGDDVSSTGGKSSNDNFVAQSIDRSLGRVPTPNQQNTPAETVDKSSNDAPIYTHQPVNPPNNIEPVSDQPVSLEWTIPAQRENGALLSASDLDGYIIEFVETSNPDSLDQTYIEGGQVSSHSMSLPPGNYRFRVIAVDSNGLTSDPSEWVDANVA